MRLSVILVALSFSAPICATEHAMHDREPSVAGEQRQKTALAAPELDIAAAPGAIALLSGSIAILLGRRKTRRPK